MSITLTPILHRKNEQIFIQGKFSSSVYKQLRTLKDIKYSSTHKSWYLPLSKEHYTTLLHFFKQHLISIDTAGLKTYLQKRKAFIKPQPINTQAALTKPKTAISISNSIANISTHNAKQLQLFIQHLQLSGKSSNTIHTYTNELCIFLKTLKTVKADELTIQRIKDYLQYCLQKLNLSENTLHSRLNALKYYYEKVLHKEAFFWEIPRPQKPLQNPRIFSKEEIANLITQTHNIKHKAMLMLGYSCGLRAGDVVNIKIYQIDSKRMQIFIEGGKGKKDRVVPLSPVLLVLLREYVKQYKPSKTGYLFEGENKNEPISIRTYQAVLKKAKIAAEILKPGSTHALRHSFATHILDKGTDITLIMKLLGHNDIKTTLRYLHVTNRDILNIKSPLDDLKL